MIRTEKLGKYYCQGSRQIAALDGIDLHIASGRFCGRDRSFRFGKVDAAQSSWLSGST